MIVVFIHYLYLIVLTMNLVSTFELRYQKPSHGYFHSLQFKFTNAILNFDTFNFSVPGVYYPPRDVFALNTGKYRPGCIFFVYTGAPVLWILSVINFRFFNNISESM